MRRHSSILLRSSGAAGHEVLRASDNAGECPRHSLTNELNCTFSPSGWKCTGSQSFCTDKRHSLAGPHRKIFRRVSLCHWACNTGLANVQPFSLHDVVCFAPATHFGGAETIWRSRSAAKSSSCCSRLTPQTREETFGTFPLYVAVVCNALNDSRCNRCFEIHSVCS